METIIPKAGESLLSLAIRCNALYICPKDAEGKRLGDLVAYAGKDEMGRNFIGDIYFNYRRIEEHLRVVAVYAEAVYAKLHRQGCLTAFDTVCGIPQGGRTFGQALAQITGKRFVYADKKPKPLVPGKKQEYEWDLSQFEFQPGERVALVEDVFNNFQNTDNTLTAIATTGADVTLLLGALNRSPVYEHAYVPKLGPCAGKTLPVIASIREPYPEYRQDDPNVIDDVQAGRLELEVKKNWAHLRALMSSHSNSTT